MPEAKAQRSCGSGLRLEGRTALITGGGGGIGGAVADVFCRNGANVLITDCDGAALKDVARNVRRRNRGAAIATAVGDVTRREDAAAVVESALTAFGGLDVLVNNAAVRSLAPVAETDPVEWDRLIAVNLLGAVNFTKAALGALRKSDHASIVMVSSCYGVVGRAGMPIYDATKAALLSLTRSLAIEEAPNGVRVNAVCPGGTLTPYTIKRNMALGKTEAEVRGEKRTDSLLGRWASTDEVAYPILWLASDEASFMTGSTIMVDGGLSAM